MTVIICVNGQVNPGSLFKNTREINVRLGSIVLCFFANFAPCNYLLYFIHPGARLPNVIYTSLLSPFYASLFFIFSAGLLQCYEMQIGEALE